MKVDSYWMNRALALARKGLGFVHPNPMVGAVILDSKGKLIGKGFHAKHGSDHAEVVALKQAGKKAKDGTLYVTLEPCCHHGKTPPCTDAILQSGIKRVVVACTDPNAKVAGQGIEKLREVGLDVDVGICESRAKKINAAFFHCIQTQKPFVRVKVAMNIEGIIGHSEKRLMLSGTEVENITMRLRAEAQAIVVGAGTVATDDPKLTVRGKYSNRKPVRVIIDPKLKTSVSSTLFQQGGDVWIFCDENQKDTAQAKQLSSAAKLIFSSPKDGKIQVSSILDHLQKSGITSILVEGGARLIGHFQEAKAIDQWIIYLNSKNLKLTFPKDKLIQLAQNPLFSLEFQSVIRRGQDLAITSMLNSCRN